jgi:hypothetical protein
MKGRPFLGVISGFFFGLFGGITLFLFGVIPLDSHVLWILPILGIVLGLLMATWAPFGSGSTSQQAPVAAASPTAPATPPAAAAADTDDTVVDEDPPVDPTADASDATEEPPAQ